MADKCKESIANLDNLDLTKFILSLMVIGLHAKPFDTFGNNEQVFGWDILARVAVPCFFMISTFLFFSKIDDDRTFKRNIVKYIKRIMSLYFFWLVVNLPWILENRLLIKGVNPINIFKMVFNSIFSSSFLGSWYLASSIFSLLFIYFFKKKFSDKSLFFITLFVNVLCIFTSSYSSLFDTNNLMYKILNLYPLYNSIFGGLFFCVIGMLLSKKAKVIATLKLSKLFALFAFSLILSYIEIYLLNKYAILGTTDNFVSLILLSISFFLIIYKVYFKVGNAISYRNMSTIFFCSHGTFIWGVDLIAVYFNLQLHSLIKYMIVLVLCFLLSRLIFKFENKYPFFKYSY